MTQCTGSDLPSHAVPATSTFGSTALGLESHYFQRSGDEGLARECWKPYMYCTQWNSTIMLYYRVYNHVISYIIISYHIHIIMIPNEDMLANRKLTGMTSPHYESIWVAGIHVGILACCTSMPRARRSVEIKMREEPERNSRMTRSRSCHILIAICYGDSTVFVKDARLLDSGHTQLSWK